LISIIHLLGNYISQEGIDDRNDEEVDFIEIESSIEDGSIDKIGKNPSTLSFPDNKEISFDESDEFESASESESELESEPEYNISHLTKYVNKSKSSTTLSSKDVESYNTALAMEGRGKYVLLAGKAASKSKKASVPEPTTSLKLEKMDQPLVTLSSPEYEASGSSPQQRVTRSSTVDVEKNLKAGVNVDANNNVNVNANNSQIKKVTKDPEPGQNTQIIANSALVNDKKPSENWSDAVPIIAPSPITKRSSKSAKKRAKKLALAVVKQQKPQTCNEINIKKQQKTSETSNSNDIKKQQEVQQKKSKNKNKNKNRNKKKNKQKVSGNDQTNSTNLSTEDSTQDIRSLILGAFANMATTLRSIVDVKTELSSQLEKIENKALVTDQEAIPEVVSTSNPKKRPSKPKNPSLSPQNSQAEALDNLIAPDIDENVSSNIKKTPINKQALKENNVSQPPIKHTTPLAAADMPTPIATPTVADDSPRSTRYPRRAIGTNSMQKLALFAQEDAKSAVNIRKERNKKKTQRSDEAIIKKPRLSIE
jgi:hypothetical protein